MIHRSVKTVVASAIALLAVVVVAGTSLTSPQAFADTTCAPVTVVAMAGTSETNPAANPNTAVGMLKGVTDRVKAKVGSKVAIVYPGYSASAFNQGKTYVESKANGKAVLQRTLQTLCGTTRVVLLGYSQGADIAGDEASDIGNSRSSFPAARILAVGLLADPGKGTAGESQVGPKTTGVGMGGNRPGGMGTLAGRVATICDPGDMYCNLDQSKYPLVSSISQMLAKSPSDATAQTKDRKTVSGLPGSVGESPTGQNGAAQLTSAVTTDWSSADLGGLAGKLTTLTGLVDPRKNGGQIDLAKVATTATSVANTLTPLLSLQTSGTDDKTTRKSLANSPVGSANRAALTVLNAAGRSDLTTAVDSATKLATTASQLASSATGVTKTSLQTTDPQAATLSTTANQLNTSTTALTTTPTDALSTATGVLSVLAPQKVINQVLNVIVGLGTTNWIGLITAIGDAIQRAVALDIVGVRKAANAFNVHIGPLVKMAANVDFKWIASILRMIPDPGGYCQIAAMVLDYVGNLDIVRLVQDIQKIEAVAFDVIEQRNLVRVVDLVPVGLDLATVAAGVLTGGTKTAADAYQPQTSATSTLSGQVSSIDFAGLTNSMSQLVSSDDAKNLAKLVDAGIEVSTFVGGATRNHVGYGKYKVDNSGRTAIEWLGDWIALKVERA